MFDSLVGLFLFIGIIYVCIIILREFKSFDISQETQKPIYKYIAKEFLMSGAEREFYQRLNKLAGDRYFIFPQVHLSAILDHHVDGQNWKYAFRHINQKSVDYVLCDKNTLKVAYAVELDDVTHNASDRILRDGEVERIFAEASIPLVRFRNQRNISDDGIINAFINSRKLD